MDIKTYLALAIKILSAFAASTATTLDDAALGLLNALQQSPDLLNWLEGLLKKTADIPDTARAEVDPSDAELAAAFNASPAVREWAAMQVKPDAPAGAEPFAVGSVLTLIKFLPTLFSLIKAAKDAGLFVKAK